MNYTDQRIDQLLHALTTTTAPTGLEQRVAARLAQHATDTAQRPTFFRRLLRGSRSATTMLPFYSAIAATLLLAAGYLVLTLHHPASRVVDLPQTALNSTTHPNIDTPGVPLTTHPTTVSASRPHPLSPASTQTAPSAINDPDAIALAETLAPSRPTPPLPLTAQETLLASSTRRGQPIEIAELETRRQSALIAIADAREQSRIREYIHGLLGPLATAQSLTPPSPAAEAAPPQPSADTEPPSSK